MTRSALFALAGAFLLAGPLFAKAYEVPAGDVGVFFATLPKDASVVTFSAADKYYSEGDIVLPDSPMLTIDGQGCHLLLGANSNGFTRNITDQRDALQRITCRYLIHDFAEIKGGKRAIDLKATYGSTISDLGVSDQTEAAIDLRFCLMCRVQNIMVTSPRMQGIVVRQADWTGASASNSQSNSTVIEQVRIYCAKSTTNAFVVQNSGGVRIMDCICEGSAADCDLYLTATTDGDEAKTAGNTVVKSFTLENFHVEHAARKQCIYVNMPPKAAVHLANIYINHPQEQPVVYFVMGQLSLTDIGWWSKDLYIGCKSHAPRINVDRCHSDLSTGTDKERLPTRAGAFRLIDPAEGIKTLDPRYIHVTNASL